MPAHRSKAFTYKSDADRFDMERNGEVGVTFLPERGSQTLAEFIEVWWAEYAIPQLAQATGIATSSRGVCISVLLLAATPCVRSRRAWLTPKVSKP